MSANRLDTVDTFDQFGHDHWKALGTKLGGVEVVKAILHGTSAVTVDIIRCLTSLTSLTVAGNSVNPHDPRGLVDVEQLQRFHPFGCVEEEGVGG